MRRSSRPYRGQRTTRPCRRVLSSVQDLVDVLLVGFDARTDPTPSHRFFLRFREWNGRVAEGVDDFLARFVGVVDQPRQQLLLGDLLSRPKADLCLKLFESRFRVFVDFHRSSHT